MRSLRPAALALLAASLLLWTSVPAGRGQGAGSLSLASDYQLIGTSELSGGGHVTWTLSGDRAQDLRGRILGLFDEYPLIPRGFRFGGSTTDQIPNGRIDREEALVFTGYLENELEGVQRGFSGTQIGYFRIERADLFDASAIERSTSGLIGTNASSPEDLQIRFLFSGRSTVADGNVALPSAAFVDALYVLFSFEAVQSPTLTPDPWPLLAEGGWHSVAVGNVTALWAGDDATGRYANAATNVTRTAPTSGSVPGLDLRFATSARVDLTYRGVVADANDGLRLEAALGPTYANWTLVASLPATGGAWVDANASLAPFLGQQVRLRMNFTSDASGTAEGFFVRDFAVRAPSTYVGPVAESSAHYLIGTLSFSELAVGAGGVNVVRTPGGEVLWYGGSWPGDAPPGDRLRFQTFNALENPQVLFGLMLVAAYMISRAQEGAFDRYRAAHPVVYRPALRKIRWLHILGKVAMGLLILLYFVPTALYNVGLRVFVSGLLYWILAIGLVAGLVVGTPFVYRRRLRASPPEGLPVGAGASAAAILPPRAAAAAHCAHCLREIGEGERTYTCTCGTPYHLSCASGLMKCPNCKKPISVEVVSKRKAATMRCESCGELQAVDEGVDPRSVICERCGGRLRDLNEGKGYLLVASNPAIAFGWLRDLARGGKKGLCLTPSSAERLRLEYGLKGIEVIQVSPGGARGIDPKQLDPVGLRPILSLSRSESGGTILYDGLDEIVNASSLGEVIRFLRKANDMAFVHGITVLARVSPASLADSEIKRLAAEFDETIDLTARL